MFQFIFNLFILAGLLYLVKEIRTANKIALSVRAQLGQQTDSALPSLTVPEQINEAMRAHLARYHRGG